MSRISQKPNNGTANYQNLRQLAYHLRKIIEGDRLDPRALPMINGIRNLAEAYDPRGAGSIRELSETLRKLAEELENQQLLTPERAQSLVKVLGRFYSPYRPFN